MVKKVKDECPLGGDVANDCADCVYTPEYHYNKETGECEQRTE